MFQNAKAISQPAPAPAKGKAKPQLEVKGVSELAMVRALEKALETVSGTFDSAVKATVFDHYVTQAQATGQRPENVRAIDPANPGASVSVALSKKASNVALNDAQVALLREHGLEPHREILTPQLYAVNPTYAGDEKLLAKVTKALAGVVPDDFIMLQEERARFTVTDELLAQVFSKKAPREVLEACTSMSCKPQLAETDINRLLDFVRGLLTPATAEAANVVAPQPAAPKKAAKKAA